MTAAAQQLHQASPGNSATLSFAGLVASSGSFCFFFGIAAAAGGFLFLPFFALLAAVVVAFFALSAAVVVVVFAFSAAVASRCCSSPSFFACSAAAFGSRCCFC